jgi:hypothetical protein
MPKPSRSDRVVRRTVPNEQLDLPVTCDRVGKRELTLRQVMELGIHTCQSLDNLPESKLAAITAKRIGIQTDFKIAVIGFGIVDREQAITEVGKLQRGSDSELGRALIRIEKLVIQDLLDQIAIPAKRR